MHRIVCHSGEGMGAFKTFGNENIADNFEKEGSVVQSIQVMEQLGLTTIGKKGKFLQTLKELTGKPIYLVEY